MPELKTLLCEIEEQVHALGGYHNAHIHLDRAGSLKSLDTKGVGTASSSALSLVQKHGLIPAIHQCGAYESETLKARVRMFIEQMVATGTTRADTVVDVDGGNLRHSALEAMASIKQEFAHRFDLNIGSYCPFGFKAGDCKNWDAVKAGAQMADFVGLLPERDDTSRYSDHIGYAESCRRGLALSEQVSKPIHIHVDQANHASDNGSETVLDMMDGLGLNHSSLEEPRVWLIHVISPSVYDEPRFARLCERLAEKHVGIVVCPSAAISMRQYRPVMSPTFNSIARALEFAAAGVHVRMGTDNMCDITSPLGTTNMTMEVFVLANALRYYDADFLAKISAGRLLNSVDQERLKSHIAESDAFVKQFVDSAP